mgnify:CR=1 FL=1
MSSHDWEMLIRLLLAAFLGGIVGIERGSGDRPAGFRTHILVCAGAALFMLVSMYGYDDYPMHGEEFPRNRDSSRIAAQVVSGIGFLGAGTIMHEGVTVRGLTTAASFICKTSPDTIICAYFFPIFPTPIRPFLILYPAYFPPSFLIYIMYIPIFLFLNPFHITSYTFSRLYCLFQQYSGIRICFCIFHAVRCRRFIPII